jgi:predicted porin
MKKTLIALAVLAVSGAAVAQSTVSISGIVDFAYAQQGGTMAGVKGTTVSSNIGTSATSAINFNVIEDLGGGMKAQGFYALDTRTWMNDASNSLGRHEAYVGVSGGFGNLRLGSPNSLTLGTWLTGTPLGTGVGAGYLPVEFGNTAVPRYNRSVRYDSPRMGGLTLSAIIVPGNDEAVTASPALNGIPNSRATTEIGAAYNQGALNIAVAHRTVDASTRAASDYELRAINGNIWHGTAGSAANEANLAAAGLKSTWTTVGANYKVGATTLYAGFNDGNGSGATALKTQGNRFGVRHDMGAIAVMGQMATQKTNGVETKVTGLRADYALSKRSAAYVGYENLDNTAATRKIASVGVRHSF